MKPDERRYLDAILERVPFSGEWPPADKIAEDLGMNHKRASYLLGKWVRKGWWEYGVSLRTGWITPLGFKETTL